MIPKIISQIWIGASPIPERERQWCNRMFEMNQGSWKYRLHGNELLERFGQDPFIKHMVSKAERTAFITDRLRVLLLKEHGGIYIDADAEPVKPFDSLPIWDKFDFVAGMRSPFRKDVALHRAVPIIDNTFMASAKDGRMINIIAALWTPGQVISENHAINGHRTGLAIIENSDYTTALLNQRYIYCEQKYPETLILHDTHNLGSWAKN